MQKNYFKGMVAALAISTFLFSCAKQQLNTGGSGTGGTTTTTTSKTAQSADLQIKLPGGDKTFSVTESGTLSLNEDLVRTYFAATPAVTGPTVELCNNCTVSNQPAAPATPVLTATELEKLIQSTVDANACVFLNGGNLIPGSTTKSVTTKGLDGKGSFTFTWTYTIAPISLEPVLAKTAWVLDTEVSGARLQVQGTVAGLSVLQKTATSKKYSFSISTFDALTGITSSRVSPVTVTLTNTATGAVETLTTDHTVQTNAPGAKAGDVGALDFKYSNLMVYGDPLLLPNTTLAPADARTLLNTDQFAGNDNGGADGSALQIANITPVQFSILAEGNYTIKLSCTIKGNAVDATVDQTITKTQNIRVIGAKSCN